MSYLANRKSWMKNSVSIVVLAASSSIGFGSVDPVHEHPDGVHPAVDPVITDPVVTATKEQIEIADPIGQQALVGWLVAISTTLDNQAAAQALYVSGHKYYSSGQLDSSTNAFVDLAALVPNTPLEIDAVRMLAQINLAQGNVGAAKNHYNTALTIAETLQGYSDRDIQVALVSFLPMMSVVSELTGDYEDTLYTSQKILDDIPVELDASLRREALRRSGRAALNMGMLNQAETQFQSFLSEYPDYGWENGTRMLAERSIKIAQGMTWGECRPEEIQFCADIVANESYRLDVSRYDIGAYLVMCLDMRGQKGAATELVTVMLSQSLVDIDLAAQEMNEERRLDIKLRGEGQLRYLYAGILSSQGLEADAMEQLNILNNDIEFGEYHNTTAIQLDIEEAIAP